MANFDPYNILNESAKCGWNGTHKQQGSKLYYLTIKIDTQNGHVARNVLRLETLFLFFSDFFPMHGFSHGKKIHFLDFFAMKIGEAKNRRKIGEE